MLIENGDTVDVDLNKVSLHFTPDLQYVYTSTLDYVEPGTFRLERGVLFTLPVGADASATRKVRIENLDSIYLFILMNDAGKLRQLQFRRLTASRPPVPVDEFNTPADSFAIDTTTYEYDSLELDGMDVDDHEEHDH